MRATLRFVLLPFTALVLLAHPAHADDQLQVNRATVLFQDGRRLIGQGRYAEACERFEQSLELVDGVGTRFNLADCWERIGRTASAQVMFAKAAVGAEQAGQPDRQQLALKRGGALEPHVSRLAIELPNPAPEVIVRRNRERVTFRALGQPEPVDPGTYDIEVNSPGKRSWSRSVKVPPGGAVVWITVPPLEAKEPSVDGGEGTLAPAAAAEPAVSAEAVGSAASPAPAEIEAPPAPRTQKPHGVTIGLVALGVGGIAAGSVFTLKYNSLAEDADDVCRSRNVDCTADDLNRYDRLASDAKASRTGAFISFGVGGAALAGAAITHWVLGLRPEVAEESALYPRPVFGADGSWGLVTRGRF